MSMPWVSRIVYSEDEVELLFEHPTPPWEPDDTGVGGSDESASGIPEAFLIRWDYITRVRIPFFEHQMAEVAAWFRWAQTSASSFWFQFDRNNEASAYEVYLHAPRLGEGSFSPRRDEYTPLFWLEISIRTVDGEPFAVDWSDLTPAAES